MSLSGCGTYVGYTHLDATPLQGGNDAYDLACWGKEVGERLSLDGALCKDLRGDEMLKVEVKWHL